jgi:protein TonB
VAVLGSVALHALLLCAAWTRPEAASQSKVQVIEARLLASPAAQVPAGSPSSPQPLVEKVTVADANPPPTAQLPPTAQPLGPLPQSQAGRAQGESAPVAAPPQEKKPPAEAIQAEETRPAPPALPAAAVPEAAAVVAASAAAYQSTSELDPPPRPLTEIQPAYPAGAGIRSGHVVLDLLIGASGAVEDVKIIEATPPGLFEASAIAAFIATRFSPGMRVGVPVAARMRVAVQYSAAGMGATVSGADAQMQPAPAALR